MQDDITTPPAGPHGPPGKPAAQLEQDDYVLMLTLIDAYDSLSLAVEQFPGAVPLDAETRLGIRSLRAKIAGAL